MGGRPGATCRCFFEHVARCALKTRSKTKAWTNERPHSRFLSSQGYANFESLLASSTRGILKSHELAIPCCSCGRLQAICSCPSSHSHRSQFGRGPSRRQHRGELDPNLANSTRRR